MAESGDAGKGEYTPPEPSRGDLAHSAGRAAFSLIPGAGGLASEVFNTVIVPPLERRLHEWREEVAAALVQLQEEGKLKFDDLRNNPVFIDTVMQAGQAALRTHRQERREALRNAVLNAALPDPPEEAIQQIFVRYADEFTVWHLHILRLFDRPGEFGDKVARSAPPGNTVPLNTLLHLAYPELQGQWRFSNLICEDLMDRGLLEIGPLDNATPVEAFRGSWRTEFGQAFLRFIQDPLNPGAIDTGSRT